MYINKYIYIYNVIRLFIYPTFIPQGSQRNAVAQGIAQPAAYDFPDAPFISLGEELWMHITQHSYWKWPLIVDLAIKNGKFPQ